jgi:hypothetical protein
VPPSPRQVGNRRRRGNVEQAPVQDVKGRACATTAAGRRPAAAWGALPATRAALCRPRRPRASSGATRRPPWCCRAGTRGPSCAWAASPARSRQRAAGCRSPTGAGTRWLANKRPTAPSGVATGLSAPTTAPRSPLSGRTWPHRIASRATRSNSRTSPSRRARNRRAAGSDLGVRVLGTGIRIEWSSPARPSQLTLNSPLRGWRDHTGGGRHG